MNWIRAIVSASLLCGLATAGTLTYTEQGILSGSLGSTPFTSALVTFTMGGAPSGTFSSGDTFWNVFPAGAASLTIAGIPGSATISNISEVAAWQCTSSCVDPAAGVAFDNGGVYVVMGTANPAFSTYSLTTAIGPLSGLTFGTGTNLSTDKGLFVISAYGGGISTFTASDVPEPGSLGLVAGAAALLLAARRRLLR